MLVEARAKPIDLRALLRLYVGRRQQLVLELVGSDGAALASESQLLLKHLLLNGVPTEWVRLLMGLVLLHIHGQVAAVGIVREAIGYALAERLGRVE